MTNGQPEPGVVSLRMQAERGRAWAIVCVLMGFFWLVLTASYVFREDGALFWVAVCTLGAAILQFVTAAIELRKRGRRIAAFQAKYGPDAGRQDPI